MRFIQYMHGFTWLAMAAVYTILAMIRTFVWVGRYLSGNNSLFFMLPHLWDFLFAIYLSSELIKNGPVGMTPAKRFLIIWICFYVLFWAAETVLFSLDVNDFVLDSVLVWVKVVFIGLTCVDYCAPKVVQRRMEDQEAARNKVVAAVFGSSTGEEDKIVKVILE